ncbi:YtxH domain-containing protein [Bacillus sp. FJAT-49736]|uniref:YtxH domain-containing protein n=1 Tax=Bacillus sp. FJAT-49736 TaxID=2833582 RepID=UPI001BC8CA9A|nr:YtxH domain-containing protein [Bacillus sp. FJAT-49736]MBS4173848.1 YtxH domain-containing protein [Bacillus sp. FJAT-49736]
MENTEMNRSEMHEKIDAKTFLIGAIVGGVFGAATALLLTPKSGKEIRGGLSGQFDSLKNKSNQLKTIASEKGTEFIALTKEKSSQLRDMTIDKGTNIAETVKEKTKHLAEKASK